MVDEFYAYLERQEGVPPLTRSWSAFIRALKQLPTEDVAQVMREVESTFVIHTHGEDYDRWSEAKRWKANEAAALALRGAQTRGSASIEQQRAMQAYTGFGGMREMGQLATVYPPLYVEASRAWEQAKRTGGAVRPEYAAIMERVKDQYFTPLDICRATWNLCQRTNPDAKVVLEPSAGIGRFMRVAPVGLLWHAVEYDPLMAQMLAYLHPEAHVYEGWFEAHHAQVGKVDLIVGNPPYGKRPPEVLRLDAPRTGDAMDYFATRGVSMLHPGGTMAYVVHLGFLTSSKRTAVRTRLLKDAAFRGAALLPSGAFPLVRDGSFAIMLWTRRAKSLAESAFSEREQAVATGQYLTLPEAEEAICGGEWRKASLGDGMYLHGAPDLSKVGGVWLAPAPTAPATTRVSVPVVSPPRAPVRREEEAEQATTSAVALQVQDWLALLNRDPNEAERQREAMRMLVLDYLGEAGNPHPKGPPALRAVVARDGYLEPVLNEPGDRSIGGQEAPDSREDFYAAVSWWSERRGYASADDLDMSEEEALSAALDTSDVMLELRSEGPQFYARWAYFTGPPSNRIDVIDAVLSAGASGPLRNKLEVQKSLILQQWSGSKTITDIDASVRSPFVPVECLQAWINYEIRPDWARSNPEIPDIVLTVEDGMMSVSKGDAGLVFAQNRASSWNLDLVYWLLAYYNRSTKVEKWDGDGTEKMVYSGLDARGVALLDSANSDKFLDWVGQQPQWVASIEAEYNLNFAPPLMSQIPTSPIDGLNTSLTLHPHQNQVVRKATLGGGARSLLIAHDVGAGKCRASSSLTLTSQGLVTIGSLFGEHLEGPEPELVLPAPRGLKVVAHVDGSPRWVPVRALYRQRIPDDEALVKLTTTRNASDEVTRAHPYPVIRGGELVWVPAGQLVEGDDLVVPQSLPEPPDAVTIDDDLATLIAWQLGDGREAPATTAHIHQKDTGVLHDLLARYQRLFGSEKLTREGNPAGRVEVPQDGHTPYLVICDEEYKAQLLELDYPWATLSADRRFPEWVIRASNHTLRLMLRAFFDAEGSPEKDKAGIEICSASYYLTRQLRYALLRFGVRTTHTEKWKRATNGTGEERLYHYLYAHGEDAAAFHEHIGFGVGWKAERLAANVVKERNPNVGIPVADLLAELAEAGFTMKMLGFNRNAGIQSVGRATAEGMLACLRSWACEMTQSRMAAGNQWSRRTLALVTEYDTVVESVADRLERLLALPVRFERVASVTPGERGGFVYDIEVDLDEYGDKNYVAGDGGLICHNTFSGIATAMRWRQTGACRRPIICVPASVLAKWYADATRLFPTARIGVVGITPGRPGADNQNVRLEKWLRFAAGAYDFLIVGHTAFFQDLEPDYDAVADVISGLMWARKQAGKQIAALRRIGVKVEQLREQIRQVEQTTDRYEYKRLYKKMQGNWEVHKQKQLVSLREALEKLEEQVRDRSEALGTDKDMATVQQALREMLEKKPYRPSTTVAIDGEDVGDDETTDEGDTTEDDDEEEKPKPKKKQKRDEVVKTKEPIPGLLAWSVIGCDGLIVDEAHKFKNLWYPANQIEYAGKGQDELFGKKSPWDMLIKCSTIHRRHGGQGGVVFLTATPMTNSPLELYNLLCMVAPHVFEDAKMYDKEAFIDRYWTVETRDVVRPKGTMEPAPALVGFKNGEELLGLISAVYDKKSTKELVDAGWIKNLPTAEAKTENFERDVVQIALIRSLVAVYTAWTSRGDEKEEEKEDGQDVANVLANLDKHLWTVRGDQLYRLHEVPENSLPAPLAERETAFRARSILRLVWVSMLDKIAIDPRLLLRYAEGVLARQAKHEEQWAKYREWKAKNAAIAAAAAAGEEEDPLPAEDEDGGGKKKKKKKGSKAPQVPSWTEELTVGLALDMFAQLRPILDAMPAYYATRPFVPKIQAVAEYIQKNKVRPQGRCGHVLFLDWKELHPQLIDAIGQLAGVPRNRIAAITGDTSKNQRLQISVDFNGRDEVTDRAGNVLQSGVEPKYDVVIGTSQAMAEGIDLQRRSCAVHHLNLPWEPATLHQRNGRAVRQGNMMGSVDVVYYLTSKTFDNVRYDKVARKAAWWEEMFRGQGATSNPAAAEDVSTDLDEVILKMVIEDEDVLAEKIAAIRLVREARLRDQRIEKANTEWLALNSAFDRARTAADQQRRDALFSVAVRRREAWKISNRDMVVPGAAELLNDEVVAIDWTTGRVLRAGSVYQETGRGPTKIVRIRVQPKSFSMIVRRRGFPYPEGRAMAQVSQEAPAEPWTFADEEADLADKLVRRSDLFRAAADISPDLVYELGIIFHKAIQERKLLGYPRRVDVGYVSPLFVQTDGRVLIAYHPADPSSLGRSHESMLADGFLDMLLETPAENVLAPTHPDAWSTWVAAIREDRVWAPKAASYSLTDPVRIRAERKVWSELSRAIFGRAVPGEAFAQRKALLGSDL